VIVGIDASNLRAGGGLTHLVELLRAIEPSAHGVEEVLVWGAAGTLNRIEDRPWLVKCREASLEKGLLYRSIWQRFQLSGLARRAKCDVLLVPGGSFGGDFHPIVTMSRNMLPFEGIELRRFGWSWMTAKLTVLRLVQMRTFQQADGLIFLTRYAHDVVMGAITTTAAKTSIIPHGIDSRFQSGAREHLPIQEYSVNRPFRLLYVSTVDVYKHQWHVAEAVARLRESGLPIVLDLIGPAYPPALERLKRTMARVDPSGDVVRYLGEVPHHLLHERYAQADVGVFASSCENMPNILLEGMASGLPMACSDRGPMPEVLGDGGVYFNPESPEDIARALRQLIESPEFRDQLARVSVARSRAFSWARCATMTFEFLATAVRSHRTISCES